MSVVKDRPEDKISLGKISSNITAYLDNPQYNKDLLNDFLIITEKMRNGNRCVQTNCSVYIWKEFDLLSLNANGGKPYWELSNIVGPDSKKFPLAEWKDAYDILERANITE